MMRHKASAFGEHADAVTEPVARAVVVARMRVGSELRVRLGEHCVWVQILINLTQWGGVGGGRWLGVIHPKGAP